MVRSALVALVTAITALLVAAGGAAATTPRSFFGVIADGPALGADGGLPQAGAIRASGTRAVRVAVYWSDLEPADGQLQLAGLDQLVLDAAKANLTLLPVVQRTPVWARRDPAALGSPPADPSLYARFLQDLVARYGPAGSLWTDHPEVARKPIRRWQVWNEPDITKFWSETDWAPGYVALLRGAYAALHAADSQAVVVAAGLTNRSWIDLRTLYAAGARPYFDEAAVHPFSRRVANVLKIVRLARAEMVRAGDARKGLALTEMSWSSGLGHSHFNYGWETSEQGQAERIRQVLPQLAALRVKDRVVGMYWYTWLSRAIGSNDSFDYGGLRRIGGGGGPVDKPALGAWRAEVAALTR